jgi:hypothetical protein
VAQRVQDAGGLAVGVEHAEAEQMPAVVVQAFERVRVIDRPEVCGQREQQLVERRAALPGDAENGLAGRPVTAATAGQTSAVREPDGRPSPASSALSPASSKPRTPVGQRAAYGSASHTPQRIVP